MFLNALLACSLLLTTASQLRIASLPLGPGEIGLVIWVGVMLCREVGRLGPPLTRPLGILLIFWLAFAVTQGIGSMTGYAIGDAHDSELFMHDALAYPLLAAISCLSVVGPGADTRLRQTSWLMICFGAALFALQVGHAWEMFDIPSVDPWYWDRLRGWSSNPNQLALLCAALVFLTLHLAETASGAGGRLLAIFCGGVFIFVGRLTKSDTFVLLLFGSVPVYAALKFRTWMAARQPNTAFRSAFAWIVILAFPLAVVAMLPLVKLIAAEAEEVAEEMTKGNVAETEQTASVRFNAWSEAISRGLESGMLGLGPGPHLEIPFEIAEGRLTSTGEPANLEHPQLNFTPNFEAHNTFLDLFTQSGLLGVMSLLWLGGMVLVGTIRARLDGLTTLMCALTTFGFFHLIIRHPVFWFAIAVCLVASQQVQSASTVRNGS